MMYTKKAQHWARTGWLSNASVAFDRASGTHRTPNLLQAEGVLGALKPCVEAVVRPVRVLEWVRDVASFTRVK